MLGRPPLPRPHGPRRTRECSRSSSTPASPTSGGDGSAVISSTKLLQVGRFTPRTAPE